MNTKVYFTSLTLLLISATPLWAEGDAARGKELHDPGCLTQCHADKADGAANNLYTRENRRVNSLEKLKTQVSFCNQQVLNSEWWPEDEADVVRYLNESFYHFE